MRILDALYACIRRPQPIRCEVLTGMRNRKSISEHDDLVVRGREFPKSSRVRLSGRIMERDLRSKAEMEPIILAIVVTELRDE